jgi:hypothetical protein
MSLTTAPDTSDLPLFQFGGRTYEAKLDAQRLGAQLTRVLQAMSDGRWRTLSEIQAHIFDTLKKRDPEASISARLRDIRKLYGEPAMESRRRVEDGVDGLWEYRSHVSCPAPEAFPLTDDPTMGAI